MVHSQALPCNFHSGRSVFASSRTPQGRQHQATIERTNRIWQPVCRDPERAQFVVIEDALARSDPADDLRYLDHCARAGLEAVDALINHPRKEPAQVVESCRAIAGVLTTRGFTTFARISRSVISLIGLSLKIGSRLLLIRFVMALPDRCLASLRTK
jgi:hypothetical protein